MIKVNQHALINLVYSYMVTKVFNIQPVLFHQYYLCHLWFKKQSFTLVWKPNSPVCSCWCSECRLYPRSARAKIASLHMISEIWLLLQCAVALQPADADLHKCDHIKFFLLGGLCVKASAICININPSSTRQKIKKSTDSAVKSHEFTSYLQ